LRRRFSQPIWKFHLKHDRASVISIELGRPRLFDLQCSWLDEVIQEGQKTKVFRKDKSSRELAEQVPSMVFGSQLLARVLGAADKIREVKPRVFESLAAQSRTIR
jgi:hypothetical protein